MIQQSQTNAPFEVYILIVPFGISPIIFVTLILVIFGNQSMIFAMSSISLFGSLVWGHHMYIVGLESEYKSLFCRSYNLNILTVPTGAKVFNWLFTCLGNLLLFHLRLSFVFFSHPLFMSTRGGLHDTDCVVARFHFVLSLGAIISIFLWNNF